MKKQFAQTNRPACSPANSHPQLSNEERQPCEIWTRVMGYHRPVSSFNIGKKGEFYERQYFVAEKSPHA
ncbi:MAG: anaerobic ribonucleoside-triphosphate reductase [Usitatibacteraceae bacterium]